METTRGLDAMWMIRFLATTKRLVTMAMWQSYSSAENIELMVNAMDRASWSVRPKSPQTYPVVRKQIKRALRYDVAALGTPTAELLRPFATQLPWQRNSNYSNADNAFVDNYAYSEIIGPDGIAVSNNLRLGLLYMAPGTLYPMHQHPADEIIFVLSGQARFKVPDRPWRVCHNGMYVFHDANTPHKIEAREKHLLALYWWRGDVTQQAQLTDPAIAS